MIQEGKVHVLYACIITSRAKPDGSPVKYKMSIRCSRFPTSGGAAGGTGTSGGDQPTFQEEGGDDDLYS